MDPDQDLQYFLKKINHVSAGQGLLITNKTTSQFIRNGTYCRSSSYGSEEPEPALPCSLARALTIYIHIIEIKYESR